MPTLSEGSPPSGSGVGEGVQAHAAWPAPVPEHVPEHVPEQLLEREPGPAQTDGLELEPGPGGGGGPGQLVLHGDAVGRLPTCWPASSPCCLPPALHRQLDRSKTKLHVPGRGAGPRGTGGGGLVSTTSTTTCCCNRAFSLMAMPFTVANSFTRGLPMPAAPPSSHRRQAAPQLHCLKQA